MQRAQLPFRAFALADVAGNGRGADRRAAIVEDRRHADGNVDRRAVFFTPDRFIGVDALAAFDFLEVLPHPGALIFRNQAQNGTAYHFFGGIAEKIFRAFVPACDHTVKGAADDGVCRRFDDSRQLCARLFGLSSLAIARLDRLSHLVEGSGEPADFVASPAHAGARAQVAFAQFRAGVDESVNGPEDERFTAPPRRRQRQHGDHSHEK